MVALSYKFVWLRYPQYYAYLVSYIQVIYIDIVPPKKILMSGHLGELLDTLKYLQNRCKTLPKLDIVVGSHRR